VQGKQLADLQNECHELTAIFVTIIKKTKNSNERGKPQTNESKPESMPSLAGHAEAAELKIKQGHIWCRSPRTPRLREKKA
jgi:hypothetical protein